MKINKEQWKKIEELNESVKSLDPILKKRIVDIELRALFGDEYLQILSMNEKLELAPKAIPESLGLATLPSATKIDEPIPTIKEFFDQKKPSTSVEEVAVFGCYLEHFNGKDEFSEADITRAYYEARARKPKVIGQSLRDAKNEKGYLVGGSKRGRFRISNIGENLVLHDLPRSN